MILKCGFGLLSLGFILTACTSPPAQPKPLPPKLVEGMWSDPLGAIGMLCFFTCTDAAIERLNALLDDPGNDARPFPDLRAEAEKHSRDHYLRPRLTDAALKNYPLDPADDPGLLRCEPWGLARQMFAPHQIEIRRVGEDRVDLRYGEWNAHRTIYMDAPRRQERLLSSSMGHSAGRWEGETLIVETTDVRANITPWRFEHGDGLQTVERFTRSDDGETLLLTATLTDPWSLRQPLVIKKIWHWAPDSEITPYEDCEPAAAVTRGVSAP
jgi:hypothetical protein